MTKEELKNRTQKFALDVIGLVSKLPANNTSQIIGKQILRSSTSVGANYRAACRARSQAGFISKITIVEEEADESLYWLELLLNAKIINSEDIHSMIKEANELTAIFTSSGKTARINKAENSKSQIRNPK
jgi:four helix bundle protein